MAVGGDGHWATLFWINAYTLLNRLHVVTWLNFELISFIYSYYRLMESR